MIRFIYILLLLGGIISCEEKESHAIVFQTDFGTKDGAVAAMKGVAVTVDDDLQLYDLTHEIPAYDMWEAGYRLNQVIGLWPKGTVFVSVVDPGVGTDRRSVVALTKSGHYIVTPDNGTLTFVADEVGIDEVRLINEEINRRKESGMSYTFHGRDVYAYTAARLASGVIDFQSVGPSVGDSVTKMDYRRASLSNGSLSGSIPVLDVQYGNVWTNIPDSLVKKIGIEYGDTLSVEIFRVLDPVELIYSGRIIFVTTFAGVPDGLPVAYMNSLMNLSFALNMGNFAAKYKIGNGPGWYVLVSKD